MPVGAQTIVTGHRGTYNTNGQSQHVRDVMDKVLMLTPYQRPIENYFMTNDWANEVTDGIHGKKEWYEDAFLPSLANCSGITGGSATEANVPVDADIFQVEDTLIVENTDQTLRVTAVSAGLIAVESFSGTITASGGATVLQRLSPAFAEGSAKAESITVQSNLKSAYPQIFKRALGMTGTQQASKFYGGNDWKYQVVKKLMELEEEIERTWIHNGASYVSNTSTSSRSFSAGCKSISTNLLAYAGDLDKAEWNAGLKQLFNSSNSNRVQAFAGSDAIENMDSFMTSIWTIMQTQEDMELKGYGLLTTSPKKTKLVTYRHPQGMVDIHHNPQLKSKYAGDIIILDPMNVKKIYMADDEEGSRKFRREMDIKTRGYDVKEMQYLSHCGLAFQLEETHMRFKKA